MRTFSENRLTRCAVAFVSALVGSAAVWFYTAHESQAIKFVDLAYCWRVIQVFVTAVFTSGAWCYRILGRRQDVHAVSERATVVLFFVAFATAFSCGAPLVMGIQVAFSGGDTVLLSFAAAAFWTAYSSYVRLKQQEGETQPVSEA